MKKTWIVWLLAALLAYGACACAEGGQVTLLPDQEAAGVFECTLGDMTLSAERNGMTKDQHKWLYLDMSLMNWTVEDKPLAQTVSAVLTWQGNYKFQAEIVCDRTVIQPLVSATGKLVFELPDIVCQADEETLTLTLTADGQQTVAPFRCPADEGSQIVASGFTYAARHGDAGDVLPLKAVLLENYEGETDEAYRWIEVSFNVFNWSEKAYAPTDIKMVLTYLNRYGFEGTVTYDFETLAPLTCGSGRALYRVPLAVVNGQAGSLGLKIGAGEQTWDEAITLTEDEGV